MEFKTVVYSDVPQSLTEDILSELDLLNQMLKVNLDVGQMLYEEDIDFNRIEFNQEQIDKISKFHSEVIGQPIMISETNQIGKVKSIRDLVDEQAGYLLDLETEVYGPARKLPISCRQYFIVSYINNHRYGGIFAFWNESYNSLFIQGITKYIIPSLIDDSTLPKLNSILDPIIQSLAKTLGAKYIYVVPLPIQGNILESLYGYQKTDNIVYPCSKIRGSSDVLRNPGSKTFYVKTLS